jgi:transcriptional regulator with XRE-family HTH domain
MAKTLKDTHKSIEKLRLDEKGWTQAQLATKAGLSAQTVRKAEKGEPVSIVSMARIAKALDTTAAKIISGD